MKQVWQTALRAGKNQATRWAIIGLASLLAFSGALWWALKPEKHHIAINGLGNPVTFVTTAKDLGAALQAQGIQLNAKDQVTPELSTSLKGKKELTVEVKKALSATIQVDGKTIETVTQAVTVADLLKEAAVELGPKDALSVDPSAPVTPGISVKVVRKTQQTKVVREEIPFDIERENDRTMMVGESKVVQEGVPGVKEVQQVTYFEDGKEVASEVIGETVVSEPVNQVLAVGTGGVVSRGGQSYRYTRELTLSATGYTAGKESNPDGNGYTYTGMRAVRGVVAVDPKVIPLYTRLYIEGYGPAIAGDIGGAIKGNRIDLCFDTLQEALDWGWRDVTVYVLND